MNATKLRQAMNRLELLYWDCHRNGGPDLEVLAILRLLQDATADADSDRDRCRECGRPGDRRAGYCSRACHAAAEGWDEEVVELTEQPPTPAA